MSVKRGILIITMILCLFLLNACGSSAGTGETGNSEYQKINLVMSVNGTDTQIDSRVARYFAQLVEERSGGNVPDMIASVKRGEQMIPSALFSYIFQNTLDFFSVCRYNTLTVR